MNSIRIFSNERECRLLVEKVVFGERLACAKCESPLARGPGYYWCKVCRRKMRLKANTWFRGSKLPYRKIVLLLRAWQGNVHPGALKALTGLSYPTIERWYSRFRQHVPRDGGVLNGVVEVDEAFFGRQKYKNQKILMGAVERKSGKLRLGEIPDRDQGTLEYFLWHKVSPESKLHTDAWTGYWDLMWYGYGHELHNHSRGHFKDTNRIENVWSVAKRQIRRMYGQIRTSKLCEFAQEWEGRRNFPDLFKSPQAFLAVTLCSTFVD